MHSGFALMTGVFIITLSPLRSIKDTKKMIGTVEFTYVFVCFVLQCVHDD